MAMAAAGTASAAHELTAEITVPATVSDNETFNVTLTAINSGDATGASVELQMYIDGAPNGTLHDFGPVPADTNRTANETLTLACGVYVINATVDPSDNVPETNETNNTASLTLLVVPFANFTNVLSGTLGSYSLALDAGASHGCAPLNFTWDIGGLTRYGAAVTFTPAAGNLTITLTARSTVNPLLVNTVTRTIVVPNAAPSLTLNLPDTAILTLVPLALSIQADDADGSIASYSINFGDGNSSSNLANASSYVYRRAGNFTVQVRVTDNLGATNQASVNVSVSNRLPVVETSFPYWATLVGTSVTFNASRSSDPEGAPLVITWNFGDGTNATGPVVNHSFSAAGTYTVRVTATDSTGATSESTITVKVDPTAPPSSSWLLPIIGGILAALLLLFLLFLLLARRRRKDDEEGKQAPKDAPPAGGAATPPAPSEGSSGKPPSP